MGNIFWRYFWMRSERRTVLSSMQRDFCEKFKKKFGRPASSHQRSYKTVDHISNSFFINGVARIIGSYLEAFVMLQCRLVNLVC